MTTDAWAPAAATHALAAATHPRPGVTPAEPGAAPLPIILDCDPGHDDALALVLALARPELRLLGVTTVGGNARLDDVTRNAAAVLTLLGRTDVPLAAGADRPVRRPLRIADHVHGVTGLDGAELPRPEVELRPEGAVALMAELLLASPHPVVLVPVGPLTNIAHLLERHPDLRTRIAGICLMGGAMGEGNITASAEFNIWVDPEAADAVFRSGLPVTMIGLDVTHQALFTSADADRLEAVGTRSARIFADLLRFFGRFHREHYGWDGAPIHDAVAVAHLLPLGLVRTIEARVDVEVTSELTLGRTVVDARGMSGLPPNAEVGVGIEREPFVDLLIEAVRTFG